MERPLLGRSHLKGPSKMLRNILDSAGLNPKLCADLLGLDHKLFQQWLVGQRAIPSYVVPELSTVLGVPPEAIIQPSPSGPSSVENAPAIWFKFRDGEKLSESDREIVVVIRRLGHFIDQMEDLTASKSITWRLLFELIRKEGDRQASPIEQGRRAAHILRTERQFGFPTVTTRGISGTGDVFRENLRSIGIRIIETPLQKSLLEGCCFYVGSPGSEKPCLFANTYQQTWFRRNRVLMHELAHAIFDIETSAASLDFANEERRKGLEELRADAFAQEILVPGAVLNHIAQTKGLKWDHLSSYDIAVLVAHTQVEQRLVIKAAMENGFVDPAKAEAYMDADIHQELKALTQRALSTQEFIEARGFRSLIPAEHRTTTVPSRALRLPLPYVCRVVQLAKENVISLGKAAQMLMIEKETLQERFGDRLAEVVA